MTHKKIFILASTALAITALPVLAQQTAQNAAEAAAKAAAQAAGQGRPRTQPVKGTEGRDGAVSTTVKGTGGRDSATPVVTAGQGKGDPTPAQLMASAQRIACGNGVQNLQISKNPGPRSPSYFVTGLCLQVFSPTTGKIFWEGTRPDNSFNLRRLGYTGGGATVRSKQAGLLSSVKLDDHLSSFGTSHVVMAQLQAGVFGTVDFISGKIEGEFSTSLYDPKTDTHTWSPSPLPTGCGPWTETAKPADPMGLFGGGLGDFFFPFDAGLQAPPGGDVLGIGYVKIPGGRCWLGGAGSPVAGVPVAFSWGPTLPLGSAYKLENGKIIDVEEAESAQVEQAMLAFGFNPGQSTLKYSGSVVTDASGNFKMPYTVETVGLGALSVRRRGYRISRIHKTQGGFRLWQRIDPASPRAPNKNGECLIGRAVVAPGGKALDITYRFKGSSC
jgi:hypothetical protein